MDMMGMGMGMGMEMAMAECNLSQNCIPAQGTSSISRPHARESSSKRGVAPGFCPTVDLDNAEQGRSDK